MFALKQRMNYYCILFFLNFSFLHCVLMGLGPVLLNGDDLVSFEQQLVTGQKGGGEFKDCETYARCSRIAD